MLGCCLISFHFLWGKLATRTVHEANGYNALMNDSQFLESRITNPNFEESAHPLGGGKDVVFPKLLYAYLQSRRGGGESNFPNPLLFLLHSPPSLFCTILFHRPLFPRRRRTIAHHTATHATRDFVCVINLH